jgi:hypothetical protein
VFKSSFIGRKLPVKNTARVFNCMRCQQQKIICRCCDRGNLYCGKKCSQTSRQTSFCTASKRYQNSQKGRLQHIKRQRHYRQCLKETATCVTHHGSKLFSPSDLLPTERRNPVDLTPATEDDILCHYCGRCCSGFLRSGFLQQSVIRKEANIFLVNMKRRIFNDNNH